MHYYNREEAERVAEETEELEELDIDCPDCNGTGIGYPVDYPCRSCRGTGIDSEYRNVVQLAKWLVAEGKIEGDRPLLDYFDKPWKWTAEWDEYYVEREQESPVTPKE